MIIPSVDDTKNRYFLSHKIEICVNRAKPKETGPRGKNCWDIVSKIHMFSFCTVERWHFFRAFEGRDIAFLGDSAGGDQLGLNGGAISEMGSCYSALFFVYLFKYKDVHHHQS